MSNNYSGDFPLYTYRNLSVGTTGSIIKASPGQIFEYYFYNNGAAIRFIKLYDKATAPTSSDTPIRTYAIGSGQGANIYITNGMGFTAGISMRGTTGVADNDTGAPSANDIIVNIGYR